ncbi:MAG: YigZ family protein [Eubacteriaceae bacterium]|nr:YigZ family protein [Eubacteriaceae bacterium]
MGSYLTISGESSAELEIKRSVFSSFAKNAQSAEEAIEYINAQKKANVNARHVAYAYAFGDNRQVVKFFDAGEPARTAGKPILGAIEQMDLSDVVVVVARVFGGVKLGASGLARAYSNAASFALKNAAIVERNQGFRCRIQASHKDYDRQTTLLEQSGCRIVEIDYSMDEPVVVFLALGSVLMDLPGKLSQIAGKKMDIAILGEEVIDLEIGGGSR